MNNGQSDFSIQILFSYSAYKNCPNNNNNNLSYLSYTNKKSYNEFVHRYINLHYYKLKSVLYNIYVGVNIT